MKNPSKNRGNKVLIVLFVIFVIITGLVAYLFYANIEPTIISNRSDEEVTRENKVEVDEVGSVEPTLVNDDLNLEKIKDFSDSDYPTFVFQYPESWELELRDDLEDCSTEYCKEYLLTKNNSELQIKLVSNVTLEGFPVGCTNDENNFKKINNAIYKAINPLDDGKDLYVTSFYTGEAEDLSFNEGTFDDQNLKVRDRFLVTGWTGPTLGTSITNSFAFCINAPTIGIPETTLESKAIPERKLFTYLSLASKAGNEQLSKEIDGIVNSMRGFEYPQQIPCEEDECRLIYRGE